MSVSYDGTVLCWLLLLDSLVGKHHPFQNLWYTLLLQTTLCSLFLVQRKFPFTLGVIICLDPNWACNSIGKTFFSFKHFFLISRGEKCLCVGLALVAIFILHKWLKSREGASLVIGGKHHSTKPAVNKNRIKQISGAQFTLLQVVNSGSLHANSRRDVHVSAP